MELVLVGGAFVEDAASKTGGRGLHGLSFSMPGSFHFPPLGIPLISSLLIPSPFSHRSCLGLFPFPSAHPASPKGRLTTSHLLGATPHGHTGFPAALCSTSLHLRAASETAGIPLSVGDYATVYIQI